MMKKFLLIIGVVGLSLLGVLGAGKPAMAVDVTVTEGSCGKQYTDTFLFMRPWYYALDCNSSGDIDQGQFSSDKMGDTIKKIVVVIIDDVLRIVGVLAAGFLIYGGLQYAYSGGDMSKAAKGKRTIQAALIGMVIALVGQVGVNAFETIITRAGGTSAEENIVVGTVTGSLNIFKVQPDKLLGTTVNFVLGAATLVSVGYIIYAGVTMMISYGNTEKTAKARKAIIYAIAGLAVSMLAFAIVNFALGGLEMAMPDGGNTELFGLVNTIFGWIVGVSGLIAVAGIVVGGVQYTIATGDAQKVQRAKHTVLYSIIGLIVVLLAGAIISFVIKAVFGS